ncbi:hypothetical protein [Spirosoma arcticum]
MIPPFRADHVGSLLRTPAIKEHRLKWKKGEISPDELRAIEDQAITETVKRLESTGMQPITDGEFRRAYFHLDRCLTNLGENRRKSKGRVCRLSWRMT